MTLKTYDGSLEDKRRGRLPHAHNTGRPVDSDSASSLVRDALSVDTSSLCLMSNALEHEQ
jgi:hypothetical protein